MKIVFHSLCKTTTLVQIKALTKYNFDLISIYTISLDCQGGLYCFETFPSPSNLWNLKVSDVTSNVTWRLCRAARQDKFATRQKLLSCLVFQLVPRHHLNACDLSTLGRILLNLPNLNSENARLPKQNLDVRKNMNSENPRVLRTNSWLLNKSWISWKSRKPSVFGSGKIWRDSKSTVFRRVG